MTPPPPPPASATSLAAASDAHSPNHTSSAAVQSKSQDGNGLSAFHALCAEQQRLVARFLALEKPSKPEMSAETLQRAQEQTRRSMKVLKEALERYRLDALSLSYNGGKDCLVLLVLYLAALAEAFPMPDYVSEQTLPYSTDAHATHDSTNSSAPNASHTSSQAPSSHASSTSSLPFALAAVYIEAPHPFPQLTSFVEESSQGYGLDLARHSGDNGLRAAFAAYCAAYPKIEAILVGTRRSDPHGANLEAFQPTDHGWPKFVRVLPMLEWHYEEIWAFLRALDIPYCELYDQGYTSLGGMNDTRPNPALSQKDDTGKESFRPAYELVGDAEERLGRDR